MKQKIDNPAGFTLIEVLIAAVIITFGMLAMGTFLGSLVSKNSINERRTIATLLAQDKIEDLRTKALTGDVTSADDATETIPASTTGAGDFTMTTTIDDSSNPNQITVVVTWDGQGASQFTLTTLVND